MQKEMTKNEEKNLQKLIEEKIAEEKAKWQEEMQTKIETAKKEGARIAKMNKEERAEEEKTMREEELKRREEEVSRREKRAMALEELSRRGLPSELIGTICIEEEKEISEIIDELEKCFNDGIDKRVNELLKARNKPKMNRGKNENKEMTYSEYIESLGR